MARYIDADIMTEAESHEYKYCPKCGQKINWRGLAE